jgi:hypothetical protein
LFTARLSEFTARLSELTARLSEGQPQELTSVWDTGILPDSPILLPAAAKVPL